MKTPNRFSTITTRIHRVYLFSNKSLELLIKQSEFLESPPNFLNPRASELAANS